MRESRPPDDGTAESAASDGDLIDAARREVDALPGSKASPSSLPAGQASDGITHTSPGGASPGGSASDSHRGSAALPPDAIAGYEILGEIHRGGQGVVYQAIQQSTRRKVAIKVMKEGPFAGPSDKARFDREVRILAQLNHPNVVTIHDSGQAAGHFYFVMDYVAGLPLDAYMAGGRRSIDETLRLFARICDAVNAAHLRGIIHRDLKPGNIRVDPAGNPHVLDFGLAKLSPGETTDATQPAALSVTGQFIGSLPWASPEQAEGIPGNVDVRTDVYSLGVILYQMLTGRFPYEVVGNMRDVLDRIIRAEPARPSTIRRQINNEVETIVLKCLGKSRDRRYQNAGELGRDIGHYLAGEPIEAKRDSAWYVLRKQMQRHKVAALVVASFALVLIAFAVTSSMQAERNRMLADDARERLSDAMVERGIRVLEADDQHGLLYLLEARTLVDHDEELSRARAGLWAAWQQGFEDRFVHAIGGPDPVTAFRFSADGKHLITGAKNLVTTWDIATGQRVGEPIQIDAEGIRAFLGDGNILEVSKNGKRYYWDLEAGKEWGSKTNNVTESAKTPRVSVWDATSGRELAAFTEGNLSANFNANTVFSPDGSRIVTFSPVNIWHIWNADTAAELGVFRAAEPQVPGIAWRSPPQFSPDGTRIVTTGDETPRVFDATDGRELLVLRGHDERVHSAVFSPDGTRIATASTDATVRVWDASNGTELAVISGLEPGTRLYPKFSPDGTRIVARAGKTAKVWNAADGREMAVLRGEASPVWDFVFSPDDARIVGVPEGTALSPDGTRLVTPSLTTGSRVWDATDGRELVDFHTPPVLETVLFPSGIRETLLPNEPDLTDTTAKLWDTTTGHQLAVLQGHEKSVGDAVFGPDGARIVTVSADKTARVWDATTGTELAVLAAHRGIVKSAAFSADGNRIVTASADKTARIWDADTGTWLAVLSGHQSDVLCAAFNPDGTRIVTASADGTARVWNAITRQERDKNSRVNLRVLRGHEDAVPFAAFSPDGTRIVTASADKTARVWDAASGRELLVLRGREEPAKNEDAREGGTKPPLHLSLPDIPISAAFSPDGAQIVTASMDGTARVWDANTGSELTVLPRHGDFLGSAAFTQDGVRVVTVSRHTSLSPDGTRLVTASMPYHVTWRVWDAASGREIPALTGPEHPRVWDITTGRVVAVLRGHEERVGNVVFSPDGTRIVTLSRDGTARIWDATSGSELAVLRGHAGGVSHAAFTSDGSRVVTAGIDDPTPRIWEWASGRELAVLRRDEDRVLRAWFSPDGARVMTMSGGTEPGPDGGTLAIGGKWRPSLFTRDAKWKVWYSSDGASTTVSVLDARTGNVTGRPLHFPEQVEVMQAQFSPDGRFLLAQVVPPDLDSEPPPVLWNVMTGERLCEQLHFGGYPKCAFSPDGRFLAVRSEIDGVGVGTLVDLATGARHGSELLIGGRFSDNQYAKPPLFSPDGRLLATELEDKVYLWDVESTASAGPPIEHGSGIGSVQFSPDGRLLATADAYVVRIWDVPGGKPRGARLTHSEIVQSVQFSPDGTLLGTLAGGRGLPGLGFPGQVRLWLTGIRQPGEQTLPHWAPETGAVFSNDGALLVTSTNESTGLRYGDTVRCTDLATMQPHGTPIKLPYRFGLKTLSPDKNILVTAGSESGRDWGLSPGTLAWPVRFWNIQTGEPVGDPVPQSFPNPRYGYSDAAFSPDGSILAVLFSNEGTVALWNTAKGQPEGDPLRPEFPSDGGMHLRFSPDGARIFAGDFRGREGGRWRGWIGWDLSTRRILPVPGGGYIASVAPAGNRMVILTESREFRLCDTSLARCYGAPIPAEDWEPSTRNVLFNWDGSVIGVRTANSIHFYSGVDGFPFGSQVLLPTAHTRSVLSPDGRLLAAAIDDTARIWETTTGQPYGPARKLDGQVLGVQFSPDSRWLTTSSETSENTETHRATHRLFRLPDAPADLREMQLRTWLTVGSRLTPSGSIEAIPPTEFESLRNERTASTPP